MSDVMKLREFIKALDEHIKKLEADSNQHIDTDDVFILADLAYEAGQDNTATKIEFLADDLEFDSLSNEDYIIEIKKIGEEYDV